MHLQASCIAESPELLRKARRYACIAAVADGANKTVAGSLTRAVPAKCLQYRDIVFHITPLLRFSRLPGGQSNDACVISRIATVFSAMRCARICSAASPTDMVRCSLRPDGAGIALLHMVSRHRRGRYRPREHGVDAANRRPLGLNAADFAHVPVVIRISWDGAEALRAPGRCRPAGIDPPCRCGANPVRLRSWRRRTSIGWFVLKYRTTLKRVNRAPLCPKSR
jgi:hypothetical protein